MRNIYVDDMKNVKYIYVCVYCFDAISFDTFGNERHQPEADFYGQSRYSIIMGNER